MKNKNLLLLKDIKLRRLKKLLPIILTINDKAVYELDNKTKTCMKDIINKYGYYQVLKIESKYEELGFYYYDFIEITLGEEV